MVTVPLLPTTLTASLTVSADSTLTVSSAWSARRPPVSAVTNSRASDAFANACVAPSSSAFSRLNSTGSTTTSGRAPAYAAPWTALMPTPPAPYTTTAWPGRTAAAFIAAPHPVRTPQPTRAPSSNGMSSGSFTQDHSLTTARSEKEPRVHIAPRSSPSLWKRKVSSSRAPVRAFRALSHRFCAPDRAGPAGAADRDEGADDPVADLDPLDHRADLLDHSCPFVAPHDREPHRHVTGAHVVVGVTQAGGFEAHQHLVRLGVVELELDDVPPLPWLPHHRGARRRRHLTGS